MIRSGGYYTSSIVAVIVAAAVGHRLVECELALGALAARDGQHGEAPGAAGRQLSRTNTWRSAARVP